MASTALHGGIWIRRARLRASLSQKVLAGRLDTSQSLVARWESGAVEPSFATVIRAVRKCGFDLAIEVVTYDADHDIHVRDNLRRTPADRLQHMYEVRHGFEELTAHVDRRNA